MLKEGLAFTFQAILYLYHAQKGIAIAIDSWGYILMTHSKE